MPTRKGPGGHEPPPPRLPDPQRRHEEGRAFEAQVLEALMIGYGLACLIVCFLADRQARPHALALFAGWIAGFAGWEWWPLISLFSSLALFTLMLRQPSRWAAAVASLAVVMLGMDLVFRVYRHFGVDIGALYADILNAGLALQLALVVHRGPSMPGIAFAAGCLIIFVIGAVLVWREVRNERDARK